MTKPTRLSKRQRRRLRREREEARCERMRRGSALVPSPALVSVASTALLVLLAFATSPQTNTLTILSGGGQVASPGEILAQRIVAQLTGPAGSPVPGALVSVNVSAGAVLLVPDPTAGTLETAAGGGTQTEDGAPALETLVPHAASATADSGARPFWADPQDGRVRWIDPATGEMHTAAGGGWMPFTTDGDNALSLLIHPVRVEAGRGSNDLIVVDAGDLAVDPPDVPKVLRISGGAAFLVAPFASVPVDASEDYHGRVWVAVTPSEIVRVEIDGTVTPVLTVPFALASLEVHPDGKRLVLGADDGVHVLDPETGDDVHHAVGAVKDATADRFGNIFAVTDAHRVV